MFDSVHFLSRYSVFNASFIDGGMACLYAVGNYSGCVFFWLE